MSSVRLTDASVRARPGRLAVALLASLLLHVVFVALFVFDVAGIGGGFGLGVGPGIGIGAGGGAGLGEKKRREIYSLQDLPELVRPEQPRTDEDAKDLVVAHTPQAISVPQPAKPKAAATATTGPVVQFARPVKPLGAGSDLGSRFASAGAGVGGLGLGGGGGGFGVSLGTAFGKYVGSLRKVGLDVALVVDASGSMQMIIDDLKERLDAVVSTMQRLVPTARIGVVVYRDRTDDKIATAPRQSEDFVVKWTDLTFSTKKVQTFLGGIVAEGGGDWPEAVKEGLDTAMTKLKWRADAKKVLILIGSSPEHAEDKAAIDRMIADWRTKNGIVSTVDVSQKLHEEHERTINRWLYGEEPKTISPLPEFYNELREAFDDIAKRGGGDSIALGSDQVLVRHVLVLAFGPQWEKDVSRIARNR